eukprot:CAMPEP_0197025572 /NCGR_PEP_ID=MMETSP1384-20130603/5852_1 /TAXON_ID=29189 /ORGANISM="Ammonia sp." /LENGTH=370 /DNA_ID=CAMNT_0042454111 /DNA_START=116 /DNA_END=1228 /DNA_ORIENTATION=+
MTARSSNESTSKTKAFSDAILIPTTTSPEHDAYASSSDDDQASNNMANDMLRYSRPKPRKQSDVISEFKEAVLNDRDSVLLALHEAHPSLDLINLKFANGDNCLQTALKHAQYNAVEYLLRAGVSPNERNEDGETVLHLAVRLNDLRAVKLLQKFRIDASIANHEGATAPDMAYRLRYDDIFDALMDDQQGDLLHMFPKELSVSNLMARLSANSQPKDSMHDNATDRLNELTDDLLLDLEQDVSEHKSQLPPLQGWLSKKQSYSWSKRWVLVREGYLLWSDREILPGEEGISAAEKKRWDFCVALQKIESVNAVPMEKDKSGQRFMVKIGGEKRESIWRATSMQSRDEWVRALTQHIAVRRQEMVLLAAK